MSRPASRPAGRRWVRWVAIGALFGVVVSVGLPPGVSLAGPSAPRPVPKSFTYENSLSYMSCPSSTFCMGVGSYDGFYQQHDRSMVGTLAEEWDGSSWSLLDTPNPTKPGFNEGYNSTFSGVSCTSSSFCVAVGNSSSDGLEYPLAEVWDGSVWSITPAWDAANQPTGLGGVSCTSSMSCLAVGSYGSPGSAAGGVQPLVEQWNGSTWSQVTVPIPENSTDTYLSKISCYSQTFCVAVGSDDGTSEPNVIEEWDGTSWTVEQAPGPAGDSSPWLTDVSCSSDTFCAAVGQGFADMLSGTTWSVVTVPEPTGGSQYLLNGVSCTSSSYCTTVGDYENHSKKWVTQAATWNGTAWSLEKTANLKGNTTSGLSDVACWSSVSCLAVGSHTVGKQSGVALLEQWAGSSWAVQSPPVVVPLGITPDSGKAGRKIRISVLGFSPDASVKVIYFSEAHGGADPLCSATTDADGAFTCKAEIPRSKAGGRGPHYVFAQEGAVLLAVAIFTLG